MSIRETFAQAGYEQYVELFESKGLAPEKLAALTDEDLQLMGVGVFEHRQALLVLLKGIAPKQPQGAGAAPASAAPAQSRNLLPWILGGLVLLGVGMVGLVFVLGAVGAWTLSSKGKELASLGSRPALQLPDLEDRREESEPEPEPYVPMPVRRAPTYEGDDKAALAQRGDEPDSEDEMRRPVDALYEAWRTLDAAQYAAQWAPGGTRTDLKSGKTSAAEQVIRSRSALFPKLQYVDAQHTSRLLSFEDGVATFYTRYTMTITSNSGKTSSEVANESYRVKKINGRWLIIENRDYEP